MEAPTGVRGYLPALPACENRGMTESGHGAAAGEGREVARDGAAAGDAPGVTHDGVTAAVSGGVAAPGALETARRSLGGDLGRGARAGLLTFWDLIKMMVPAYFVALLLERLGVVLCRSQALRDHAVFHRHLFQGTRPIIITEKDAARLDFHPPETDIPVYVLRISLEDYNL